jgi:hypothetical protein
VRVDPIAADGYEGADVAAARAQLDPVRRALGGAVDVAGRGRRHHREAAEAVNGHGAGAGRDARRAVEAGDADVAAGRPHVDQHVVGHRDPVAHAAAAEDGLGAAGDDPQHAALHAAGHARRLAERVALGPPDVDGAARAAGDLDGGGAEVELDGRQGADDAVVAVAGGGRGGPPDAHHGGDADQHERGRGDQQPPWRRPPGRARQADR